MENQRSGPLEKPHPSIGDFDTIYRAYRPWVRRLILSQVRVAADADEITQEVFFRVHKALPNFVGDDVRPWLGRICRNACIDHHRRARRVRLVSFPEDFELATPVHTDHMSDKVETVLAGLQPQHAVALRLRSEGWSHEDIAGLMGTTAKRVKALLHRARCAFRGQWATA